MKNNDRRPYRVNGKEVVVDSGNVNYGNTNVEEVLDDVIGRVEDLEEGGGSGGSGGVELTTKYRRNLFRQVDVIDNKTLAVAEQWYGAPTNHNGHSIIYIPVEANKDYIIYHEDGKWDKPQTNFPHMIYVFCDSTKAAISVHDFGYYTGGINNPTKTADDCETVIDAYNRRLHTPANCAYLLMVVNYGTGGCNYTNTLWVEEGSYPSEHRDAVQCVTKINGMPIMTEENDRKIEPDVNLNVYIAGDSIGSWYAGHWGSITDKFSFKSIRNISIGGSYWGFHSTSKWQYIADGTDNFDTTNLVDANYTHVSNVVAAQIYRLIDRVENQDWPTPELMLIHAGTNDPGRQITCGNADNVFDWGSTGYGYDDFLDIVDTIDEAADNDELVGQPVPTQLLTSMGGLRFTLELLWKHFPYCRVVLTTPIHRQSISGENNTKTMAAQITKACDYLGVPCFNLRGCCQIYAPFEQYSETASLSRVRYLQDGLHPDTDHGGKLLADIIGRYLVANYGGKDWFKLD